LTGRRFVDANAIAQLLGVPVTWVRESARAGAIPHRRFGRYMRFDEDEVLAWTEDCRKGGRPADLRRYAERVNGPRGAVTPGGPTPRR
jgi:excisionase family DNA binding protein